MALIYLTDHYEVVSVLMGMCNTPPSSGRVCGKIQLRRFPWVKVVRCLCWKKKICYTQMMICVQEHVCLWLKYYIRALAWVSKWTKCGRSGWRACFTLWIYVVPSSFGSHLQTMTCVCFQSRVPTKTPERLKMPSLLSTQTGGLCMCVNVWPRIQRAAARASRRRSRARAHCPVNTAGSEWRATTTAPLLRRKCASGHSVRLHFNRRSIHKNKQLFVRAYL